MQKGFFKTILYNGNCVSGVAYGYKRINRHRPSQILYRSDVFKSYFVFNYSNTILFVVFIFKTSAW